MILAPKDQARVVWKVDIINAIYQLNHCPADSRGLFCEHSSTEEWFIWWIGLATFCSSWTIPKSLWMIGQLTNRVTNCSLASIIILPTCKVGGKVGVQAQRHIRTEVTSSFWDYGYSKMHFYSPLGRERHCESCVLPKNVTQWTWPVLEARSLDPEPLV